MAFKIVVTIVGIMIQLFEQFLCSNELMNTYLASCLSSWVALLMLKKMFYKIISIYPLFCNFRGEYQYFHTWMLCSVVKYLLKTSLNVALTNFTLRLSRMELTKKLTLKMVKETKKKDRHANILRKKNFDEDMSTWTRE